MYPLNAPRHLSRSVAPNRTRTAVLVTLALLSAACSDDASSLTSPLGASASVVATPAAASMFAVLAQASITCTDGVISGDVGTFVTSPAGSVTQSRCPVSGSLRVGGEIAQQAFNYLLATYESLAPKPGDVCTMLTGTLAGITLAPGTYCFDAAAGLTGVLTLDGPSDAHWTFKIGSGGGGALTATSLSMVLAGGAQARNVTWHIADAVTLTTTTFLGRILAGADITTTGGTLDGHAWAKGSVTITGTAVTTFEGTAPALAVLTVSPNPTSVAANGMVTFSAAGTDVDGNTVAVSPVWEVVNGGGSIDSSTGVFTAGAVAGTFEGSIRASSDEISGTSTVTVTVTVVAPPDSGLTLGSAAPNGIMAGTAVSCVIGGVVNADVSVSPGNTITGFGPCEITGVQHLGDSIAAQGQLDLTIAYNTLAGLACGTTITADLGGTTQPAGVYCAGGAIGVTGTLTLDGGGDPDARFVFQAGSGLTTAGNVVLINGAQAKNVYWKVGSSATLGTASQWQGNVVALTSITMVDNATLVGRALARNGAVTLGTNNSITLP